jgi:hypothetical protein
MNKPASWQLTATTIKCDIVDDEATIIIYKDWSAKCTGYSRYASSSKASGLNKKKSLSPGRRLKCLGTQCPKVIEYREKLLSEESGSGNTS